MIKKIQATLKKGTRLFKGHNADNSTAGRESVGEVLTSFTKEIGGKLRTIAIAAMEKVDSVLYDICSIEATVLEDNGIVGDVDQVTGIAVSNSRNDSPAFSSATKMATVQCFDPDLPGKLGGSSKEKKMPVTLEDLSTTPIALIKEAVQMRRMHPSQLFDVKDLEDDRDFGEIVRKSGDLQKTVEDLSKQLEESKSQLGEFEKESKTREVSDLFSGALDKKFKDNKISKSHKDFLELNFSPDKLDTLDKDGVDKYFESATEDFQKYARVFGKDTGGDEDLTDEHGSGDDGDVSLDDVFEEE